MTRSTWIALAVLVAITAGVRQCGTSRSVSRPALAWDGDEYIAAWRKGGDIYVQIEGRPPQIVYSHRTVGDPTITTTASGFLVATSRMADGDGDWRDEVIIPLDRDAFPREPRVIKHAVSAERTCSSTMSSGRLITGYIGHHRDGRPGNVLSVYDARGVQVASDVSVSPFLDRECAIVERDGELAVIDRSEWNLVVSVRKAADLEWIEDPFPIPIQEAHRGWPWHLSATLMSRFGRSYGALVRDREDRLRVVQFTAHGPGLSLPLDEDVDAETVDLGRSDRGAFVTWVAGKTLHVRSVFTSVDTTRGARPGTQVRAANDGDTCMVGMLAPDGGRVDIAELEDCL